MLSTLYEMLYTGSLNVPKLRTMALIVNTACGDARWRTIVTSASWGTLRFTVAP